MQKNMLRLYSETENTTLEINLMISCLAKTVSSPISRQISLDEQKLLRQDLNWDIN